MSTSEIGLLEAAERIRCSAHAPYSGYLVGAALEDEHGVWHMGCNVENVSFPEGACAETAAIGAMVVAEGRQIKMIAVVGGLRGRDPEKCLPCGGCRQRLMEFADNDLVIVTRGVNKGVERYTLGDLLPHAFHR